VKFLLDENVPRTIRKFLSDSGYEGNTLQDLGQSGLVNGDVAKLAISMNATILTFDSDFLTLKKSVQRQIRVIYIKMHPRDPVKAKTWL
jgi:predicted nuclease of predicted toxin-antitoxin system